MRSTPYPSKRRTRAAGLVAVVVTISAALRSPAAIISSDASSPSTFATSVGIGTTAPAAGLDIALTGSSASALILPRDSTTNRPYSPVNGMLRYNTSFGAVEGFVNGSWSTMNSGGGAGVTSVVTGTGLLGGPITSSGTLSVNVGTGPGQIVQQNASSQILQSNGTASAPSYSFSSNPGSGLFSPGTNQLALATSGTAALTITASGFVGIGTTNPSSMLHVRGGAIVSDSASSSVAYVNFGLANVQMSSTTATTINVCGLKDGGAYTLVLTGIAAASTVTVNAYPTYVSTSSCSGTAMQVDLGAGNVSFISAGNTNILSFIFFAGRGANGTVYGSPATNFSY